MPNLNGLLHLAATRFAVPQQQVELLTCEVCRLGFANLANSFFHNNDDASPIRCK